MEREAESREVMDRFMRLVRKYNAMEKVPLRRGEYLNLYHSERHLLDKIGENPGINVTEFAKVVGVTKGAISQVVRKLEKKGLVRRYKKNNNDKEVFIELTDNGGGIYEERKKLNQETIREISEELGRYSDGEVAFLLGMFRWFEMFLDSSRKKMLHNGEY
jgi:DNA-binding MarR family transcriptional regulator